MPAEFDPKGKTFLKRLQAFMLDAKKKYGVSIKKDKGRTAEWQQKHHIAHMLAYNGYRSTKPAKTELGKRTIAWSHFSDPKVVWQTVRWTDFLRTKKNTIPQKQLTEWKKGSEPDREATERHVKAMLRAAGIGDGGKAMVSAGIKPCGEPCRCKAGRSKHLENLAADLNTGDLTLLTSALKKNNGPDLDAYLKEFGLHRPLLNHSKTPEPWHVEALADDKL